MPIVLFPEFSMVVLCLLASLAVLKRVYLVLYDEEVLILTKRALYPYVYASALLIFLFGFRIGYRMLSFRIVNGECRACKKWLGISIF